VVAALPKAHGLARRLIALGLAPGAELRVLQNRGRGPVLVEVHGARVALGWGQAARVEVEPVEVPRRAPAAASLQSGEHPGED
jgi:Fe2+ transport system protein FeoA